MSECTCAVRAGKNGKEEREIKGGRAKANPIYICILEFCTSLVCEYSYRRKYLSGKVKNLSTPGAYRRPDRLRGREGKISCL